MSNPNLTIIGRIGTDPEFKTYNGTPVVKFRVITSDRRKNDQGQWEDVNTSGWNVSAWNNVADSAKGTLKKGQEVIIMGNMKEDTWKDAEGNTRRSVDIKASNIGISTYSVKKGISVEPSDNDWEADSPVNWDDI
jgi:single-strand DNA-binding protein